MDIQCKKVAFESRSEADKRIYEVSKLPCTKKIGVKPVRSYKCAECKQWHITSMSGKKYKTMNTPEKLAVVIEQERAGRKRHRINKEASYWCKKLGIDFDDT